MTDVVPPPWVPASQAAAGRDWAVRAGLGACAGAAMLLGVGLLAALVAGWASAPAGPGLLAEAAVGTLVLTALATTAIPFAVVAGILVAERELRAAGALFRHMRAVPSVVYAIAGAALLTPHVPAAAAVGTTLGVLLVPPIATASADATAAVLVHREAARALGATRWQVLQNVLIPLALPRIGAAVLEALARLVGEAAPVVLIAVWAGQRVPALSAHVFDLSGSAPREAWASAILLVGLVGVAQLAGDRLRAGGG